MNILLGFLFHITGGVAAGSFYMPFKKVKEWNWENYWIVGGFFSWMIVPFLAAWVFFPDFLSVVFSGNYPIFYVILFGVLWGIGGLTYGLGIRYLGMSLGNSVILGFTSVFGSLLPAIYYDFTNTEGKETISMMASKTGGQVVLLGILLCVISIVLLGRAGFLKDKDLKSDKNNSEYNIKLGIFVAIFSGILSACFNYGIEAGKPLAEASMARGVNPLFQNNITFAVLLWGGFATNFIWCMALNFKNRSFNQYLDKSKPLRKNYLFAALAGTIWFLQFFFYGMGESKLGNGASSWILHMASIILVGNLWGIVLKEWRGVKKSTLKFLYLGIICLLGSIALVGIGNSLD
ncbi:L-rhamnose/proton symporter RhaT [Mangrovimonas sp. ST2L15]|uniref:L-rhamnose/proton symporter RhaT n=1 Tax=Mangrovimonas sp. ST2L15 TaxID=1645916 RepID=UPI0006B43A4D|nr:L-rhamnose/proton symporter RhaT [Mangrovimonas sp. ST2L15]